MGFKRHILPDKFLSGEALTSALIGIGIRLNGRSRRNANIEDTLIAASLEGLAGDGRVFSLLVDWMDIHHSRVNADRLIQLVRKLAPQCPPLFRAFWSAMAQWLGSDSRFARLKKSAPKKRLDFLGERTDFLVQKNGEDERFEKTCLRVPNKVFRHRPEDILSPEELGKIHLPYRFRILMGPSYRADMWAMLYQNPDMATADLARSCYGSYPTAFMVKKDFLLIHGRIPALQAL